MQLIRGFGVTEHDNKRTVEEFGAVNFDLICECVPRELCYVSLEV